MLRLTRLDIMVPGGYAYVQHETGMRFDGNTPLRAQGKQLEAHRKANGLPRATFAEAIEDIEAATCARVPGMCYDTNAPAASAAAIMATAWRGCGSCGGRRA